MDFPWMASSKIMTWRRFIYCESLALAWAYSQLALKTYINQLILICVLPCDSLPLLYTVLQSCSASRWWRVHFPEFLSLPRNSAYFLLPSYWPFTFLLNQSDSALAETYLRIYKNIILQKLLVLKRYHHWNSGVATQVARCLECTGPGDGGMVLNPIFLYCSWFRIPGCAGYMEAYKTRNT